MKKFRLYYHISNNGDGSASACFHKTEQEAKKADEEMEEGWGESSASHVDLELVDGKLYFYNYEYNGKKGKYEYVKIPVREVK